MTNPTNDLSDINPETYTLDFLMSLDPVTELSTDPNDGRKFRDLNNIIQYHRNIRADRAVGKRKVKTAANAPTPKGILELIKSKKKPVEEFDRRGL